MGWQQKITGILLLGLTASCADGRREQQLTWREQVLAEKERQFAVKEADYQLLLRMRDSLLAAADAPEQQAWPEDIQGRWSSKTICKESTCTEYVVGDQRSTAWEFTGDSTGLFTKVFDRNMVTRVFSASFDSSTVRLLFQSDSAAHKNMQISVELSRVSPGLMKGSQLLRIDNNCAARFSVELVRASN
ncbi:hypothetical protein [Chitinophaga alhagiae]|uniref:hypothetical protein n=1 Tax=Chitinophaga alhagiae TaxID=2203219 RepID=UPI000E5AB120|nr:hypothetical protein [Chitinophaga alhagiae]